MQIATVNRFPSTLAAIMGWREKEKNNKCETSDLITCVSAEISLCYG